jgi:hypothetical protein
MSGSPEKGAKAGLVRAVDRAPDPAGEAVPEPADPAERELDITVLAVVAVDPATSASPL